MPLTWNDGAVADWRVLKIAVVGPGIVGMPMAAMLAHARVCIGGDDPAEVVVVQRNSRTSGWKVGAINSGKSPIGGIEPDLERILGEAVETGLLRATHDYTELADADVVLIAVQTDKKGREPDYGPLLSAIDDVAANLCNRPEGNVPLVVIESTLAPSSMATVVRERFAAGGVEEGRDVLLGNSPNRVMPGRLVQRVSESDKLVGGLHPETPKLIQRLYGHIVTQGALLTTNSLTAEVVKTLENAYRDVRIAFAAEVVRHCDAHDIDFFALRARINGRLAQQDAANEDPNAVPSGGVLVPTVGVGGHCLPKDGVLLWWRRLESGHDGADSLILAARRVNDASPGETLALAEREFGSLSGPVALLGTAYRFNSDDTRNSPTLALARLLLDRGVDVRIHDPYVKVDDQNIEAYEVREHYTRDLDAALEGAHVAIVCTAHRPYLDELPGKLRACGSLVGVVDGCNAFHAEDFAGASACYVGIGRGTQPPPDALVESVLAGFHAVERGVANEVAALADFLSERYAPTEFERVSMDDVRRLAATCGTGCEIVAPGPVEAVLPLEGFLPELVRLAAG